MAKDESAPTIPQEDWDAARALLMQDRDRLRADLGFLDAMGLKTVAPNVVEFFPAALARLEAAHAREQSARQEIESLVKANFEAQAQTSELVLNLLESRNNSDLARRVDLAAVQKFGLLGGVIAVEAPDDKGPAPAGWEALPEGIVDLLLGDGRATRFGPCIEARDLFHAAGAPVQSCALIRMSLWSDDRPAILAFASADPEGFTPSMGAELVSFLARVVERTAARWPSL
jgi:hypothetical protein